MKILVIDDNYPSLTNLYGDVFAHVRIKEYKKKYIDTIVAAKLTSLGENYTYEDIEVVSCNNDMKVLHTTIATFQPTIILIHFATFPIIKQVVFKYSVPFIIWVHGFEALGWYRRIFNFTTIAHFLRYIKGNMVQLFYFRKLIKFANKSSEVTLVFVSEWMKKIAETDCFAKVDKYKIIANPINNHLFFPEEKPAELRKHILMIRPFSSKKYGTDIVTEAMLLLQQKPIFKELQFTIYGAGAFTSPLYQAFKDCNNVQIHEGFLKQTEVKALHSKHGVFFALTRQDAQGVSMCEAMSSGLVPITSNNTAIPEFVQDGYSGILTNNKPEEVSAAIEKLVLEPALFSKLSKQAAAAIILKTGIDNVASQEITLIEQHLKK